MCNKSNSLKSLFAPDSVAIIGASEVTTKIGGRPIKFMKKFNYKGTIIPINPKYEEVQGLKCYPDLKAYPDEIDLAIVAVPANYALDTLNQCVAKGVKVAIVFSSGFAEAGEYDAQNKMKELAEESGMRILGPNCLGAVNAKAGFTGIFSTGLARLDNYNNVKKSAFITQSGAFGIIIDSLSHAEKQGFGYFINTGNESDIQLADCIEYAVDNDLVKVLAVYCEGVRNGDNFIRAIKKAKDKKIPIVLSKVGVSSVGGRAASSHTGSIVGTNDVYNAIFDKYGVIRANTTAEVLDFVTLAEMGQFPRGRKVCVVTNSGGAGIYLADKCAETNMELPMLNPELRKELDKIMPSFASSANPVDTTAQLVNDPTLLEKALTIISKDDNIDSILVFIGLMDGYEDTFIKTVKKVQKTTDKYIMLSWMSPPLGAVDKAKAVGLPILTDPYRSVRALSMLAEFNEKVLNSEEVEEKEVPLPEESIKAIRAKITQIKAEGRIKLSEYESKELLALAGVPIPKTGLASTCKDVCRIAKEIGFPVVMKIESSDILHKTDARCVKLDIKSEEEVKVAFHEIMANAKAYKADAVIDGINVQKQITQGVEMIVGVKQDSIFGMNIMLGAGGILVELLNEVSLRVLPVTKSEVTKMLGSLKINKMLKGFRGAPPADIEALIDCVMAVGQLALTVQDMVKEMEINPLFVTPEGVFAGDALISLE